MTPNDIMLFQGLSAPSLENLLPAVDENKYQNLQCSSVQKVRDL